ncbi:hypothetical protein GGQ84_002316 [Desulfitispora alkaliphila]|uniref:hypothetical protein n=1 Tax=Desulfitispora alkaliphila TaxID=622674 RepID=UPI003D1C45FC
MLKKMRITLRMKLITSLLLVGIISALAVGLLSLNQSRSAIQEEAFAKLTMFADFSEQNFDSFLSFVGRMCSS